MIGRAAWRGDSKRYYASMGAIAEVRAGGTIVDCPCIRIDRSGPILFFDALTPS